MNDVYQRRVGDNNMYNGTIYSPGIRVVCRPPPGLSPPGLSPPGLSPPGLSPPTQHAYPYRPPELYASSDISSTMSTPSNLRLDSPTFMPRENYHYNHTDISFSRNNSDSLLYRISGASMVPDRLDMEEKLRIREEFRAKEEIRAKEEFRIREEFRAKEELRIREEEFRIREEEFRIREELRIIEELRVKEELRAIWNRADNSIITNKFNPHGTIGQESKEKVLQKMLTNIKSDGTNRTHVTKLIKSQNVKLQNMSKESYVAIVTNDFNQNKNKVAGTNGKKFVTLKKHNGVAPPGLPKKTKGRGQMKWQARTLPTKYQHK